MDIIFSVFDLWITRGSQSWVNVLQIGKFRLFYIEWDYSNEVQWLTVFGVNLKRKGL